MTVATLEGGAATQVTAATGNPNQAIHTVFQCLSNELNTPKVLVCPSDSRTAASSFAHTTPPAGQTAFGYTNVSYFIGLDALDTYPQMFLAGDRNIGTLAGTTVTPYTGLRVLGTNLPNGSVAGAGAWSDAQHQKSGNVGLADGSVQGFTVSKLRDGLRNSGDPTSTSAATGNRLLFTNPNAP